MTQDKPDRRIFVFQLDILVETSQVEIQLPEISWLECPLLQLDGDHLKLVYVAPGTGAWAEATWWAFKKK